MRPTDFHIESVGRIFNTTESLFAVAGDTFSGLHRDHAPHPIYARIFGRKTLVTVSARLDLKFDIYRTADLSLVARHLRISRYQIAALVDDPILHAVTFGRERPHLMGYGQMPAHRNDRITSRCLHTLSI